MNGYYGYGYSPYVGQQPTMLPHSERFDVDPQLVNEVHNFILNLKAKNYPGWTIAEILIKFAAFESARLGWGVGQMQAYFGQLMSSYGGAR